MRKKAKKKELKKMMDTYYDFIINYLINLKDDELLDLWNDYCSEENMDDYIYYNDEDFFEEYFINNVDEAVRAVCYGDYRYRDTYVIFNGYANLESFNKHSLDHYIYISDLASYLEDNHFLEDEYFDYVEENQEIQK